MKISGIDTFPIAIPYHTPWRNRHTEIEGKPKTHLETTILRVLTDEGLVGLGEAAGQDVPAVVAERVVPILKGQDPLDLAPCWPKSRRCSARPPFSRESTLPCTTSPVRR